jgi:hypothetical protein
MVLLEGYMASCGQLWAQKWCEPKPPSTTSIITFLNDIRLPPLIPLTTLSPLTTQHLSSHVIYPRIHSSCLLIGCMPPRIPIHDQLIIDKVRRRASYSRDRVRLASKISSTNKELSLSHRSMQNISKTLQ